jgi:metal-sulfur cluster biosynthetic enzyme
MPVLEETVFEALKQVRDPELMINVVDLGLIYGVAIEEAPEEKSKVGVVMTMTSPACPYGPQLVQDVKDKTSALDGVVDVTVKVTLTPQWTPEMMTEEARDELGMF